MSRAVIRIPYSLDVASALALSIELAKVQPRDEFVLDFSKVGNVEPFGMLVVSSEIRRLRARYPRVGVAVQGHQQMSYAAHMGFFQACGLDFGKAPGQAKGSVRYVPMTALNCEELKRAAASHGTEVGDEVEAQARKLAAMLCGQDEGQVCEALTYSLREMMRNVVEHSGGEEIWLCAQYWPSKARVEVAIVDQGIGLRRSLTHNPHLDVSDDKRAVNYALMPAVSGKAFKGAPNRQRGHWANSGFGLYMTSRICRNDGTFLVASGDVGMLLTKAAQAKRYFPAKFDGTAIRMVIRTDRIANLKQALERYRMEGFAIQARYKEIASIDPSSASLMLSEDFDLSLWDRLLKTLKGRK